MFTGIVQGKAVIANITDHSADEFRTLSVQFPTGTLDGLKTGASIAINGTCLTVRKFNSSTSQVEFDVIAESLRKTNLGQLKTGDNVNFERAAKIGDEIGGHLMSGHITCTSDLLRKQRTPANVELVFEIPSGISDYLLDKGFVGLNGCSLTLAEVTEHTFSVFLIPETLEMTTFGEMVEGTQVNLEIDPQTQAIVDTVKKMKVRNEML